MLKFIIISIVVVGIQLIIVPMLNIIYGQESNVPVMILFFTYLALVTGEVNTLKISFLNKALAFFGALAAGLAIVYHYDAMEVVRNTYLQVALFISLFGLLVFIGRAFLYVLYSDTSFSHNYFKVNMLSAFVAVTWIFLLPFLGLSISFLMVGLLGIFLSRILPQKTGEYIKHRFEEPICNREDLWTVVLGFLSGGLIATYFEVIGTALSPNGFEFPVYLITVFLFFAFSAKYINTIRKLFNPFEGVSLALLTFALILFSLFVEMDDGQPVIYLGDVAHFTYMADIPYFGYTFMMIVFLLLPYLFITPLIPLRDIQEPSRNHFFYCSLGNLLGFTVFSFMIQNFPIYVKIIILGFVALLWTLRTRKIFVAIPVAVITVFVAFAPNIESTMVKQALGTFRYIWLDDQSKGMVAPLDYDVMLVEHIVKSNGKVGAKTNVGDKAYLSLGGYITSITSNYGPDSTDVQAAFATHVLSPKGAKILVMGMGNQFILTVLEKSSQKSDNIQIDVVDNFEGFKDIDFRQKVSGNFGFDWNKSEVNFIYGDALNYVANTSKRYDAIIWNLTVINYETARKLFTTDFFQAIKNALTDSGFYIGNLYQNELLDCTITENFDEVKYVEIPYTTAIFAASKKGQAPELVGNVFDSSVCHGVALNSLANPFKFYTPERYQTTKAYYYEPRRQNMVHDYEKHAYSHSHVRIALPTEWERHKNGIKAFFKLHNTYKMTHFYDYGATDKGMLKATLKANQSAQRGRWNDICFGAPSSTAQLKLSSMAEELFCTPLVSQVTGSKEINKHVPTVSTFYGPESYLQGIFTAITENLHEINNVYIVNSQEYPYFDDIAEVIQN
jgi:hypothetical protein